MKEELIMNRSETSSLQYELTKQSNLLTFKRAKNHTRKQELINKMIIIDKLKSEIAMHEDKPADDSKLKLV